MHFHQTVAKEIIIEIVMALKAQGSIRGDLIALMYKKYSECTEIVIKCAEKLAPYESAKLQSLEVKNTHEHRFVLRAPEQASSTGEWMKQVGISSVKEITTSYNNEEIEEEDED